MNKGLLKPEARFRGLGSRFQGYSYDGGELRREGEGGKTDGGRGRRVMILTAL
jgi:hypothetical protein